ncbi:MAG: hypothetical protein ACPGSC_12530, partial [Granulosicoccaceae bacterium]
GEFDHVTGLCWRRQYLFDAFSNNFSKEPFEPRSGILPEPNNLSTGSRKLIRLPSLPAVWRRGEVYTFPLLAQGQFHIFLQLITQAVENQ